MRRNGINTAKCLVTAALATGLAALAHASTFTIGGSGNTFIVTRDDTTAAETVNYRTVSLSAYAGQHLCPEFLLEKYRERVARETGKPCPGLFLSVSLSPRQSSSTAFAEILQEELYGHQQ